MSAIVLATINVRHAHTSLALRCLLANLGPWQPQARLVEFVSGARIETMAERLLAHDPRVIALSVYVWNVEESTRLVALLKVLAPRVRIVLGGPEVSHETASQSIVALADHVITGPGEISFRKLCDALLAGPPPLMKIIAGESGDPDALASPYPFYSAEDLAHRHVYVEASRGCPFRCEFCLSSLDRTAVPFDTDRFLDALDALHRRGARSFKFIDRTFNLKVATSVAILDFLLARLNATPNDPVFAHFELVPDHLPAALRDRLAAFPPGSLQLEIGIQTWAPAVQARISRRQDNDKAVENLRWLRANTNAHLHVDLIGGLPGEDLASFAAGFDRLWSLRPHEIQVGVLKRLRGTPIIRHTQAHDLRFNPNPPYNVLATDCLPFADMQRLSRFARYWDLVANAGRFPRTLPLLLGDAPFARFMQWSDWLYAHSDSTHRFAAHRLHALLATWLHEAPLAPGRSRTDLAAALADDGAALGAPRRDGATPRGQATPPRQQRFASAAPRAA